MLRLGLALALWIALTFAFASPAAWAEAPTGTAEGTAVTAPAPEARVKPKPERRRLTTEERWRGKPYLRVRSEDSMLRGQALNQALPPSAPTFSTGGIGLRTAEGDDLRKRALDMALPANGVNRPFPTGF